LQRIKSDNLAAGCKVDKKDLNYKNYFGKIRSWFSLIHKEQMLKYWCTIGNNYKFEHLLKRLTLELVETEKKQWNRQITFFTHCNYLNFNKKIIKSNDLWKFLFNLKNIFKNKI